MKTKLLFAACFLITILLKAQIITTIAGTGVAGYSGDGGQATAAQLNEPYSIIMDSGGNIYFTEWFQNKIIRKVTPSGIISTVAGNGTGGYSGDGGQATNAKLADPSGIAFDSHGNLYISDDTNNVIRKVNSSGIITTVVGTGVAGYSGDGGQATLSQLNYPMGITFDSQDNLYIAEGNNNSIRMVNTAGIITTVAGNGFGGYGGDGGQATATELNDPTNVMTDAVGNIYITDFANNRVRKVDKTTGIITTIVGSGPPGYYQGSYSGDGGQATSATLSHPIDTKFDSQGNLYISDAYNQRIRKISTSGIITTIAGNGVIGYAGDGGLATTSKLNYPSGIFIDITGNLYTADQYNHRIRKIGLSTTSVPDPNFKASSNIVCAGAIITFSDSTTNAIVTSYQWSFPGGNLVSGYTLTDASPKVIYNTPGLYAVTYTASNSAGQASITKTAYINVQIATATYNTAMSEGFETISVPGTDWNVSNSANSNWTLTSTAAATGLKSVMINNLANTTNNVSNLIGPTFNLSAINSPVLSFDMAYKQAAITNTDKLQVFVSIDCGSSWISKWARSGTPLQPTSVSGQSSSPFTPIASEFTTYTVNINSVASNTNVMFKWAFTSGASSVGNNIYLDNINIYDATSLGIKNITEDATFTIYPNPSNGNFEIETNVSTKQTLQIIDITGRIVLTQTINGKTTIDATNLNEGIYNISIISDKSVINKKLIIAR